MTIADFKRRLKDTRLVDGMKGIGFSVGPDFLFFYRLRGEFIDLINLQPLAGGNGLRIHVSVYLPSILPNYDMTKFPKGLGSACGNISYLYLTTNGIAYGGNHWKTKTDDIFQDSVNGILAKVESELIPWFDSIETKKDLYNSIHENVRVDNGDYSRMLEREFLGKKS